MQFILKFFNNGKSVFASLLTTLLERTRECQFRQSQNGIYQIANKTRNKWIFEPTAIFGQFTNCSFFSWTLFPENPVDDGPAFCFFQSFSRRGKDEFPKVEKLTRLGGSISSKSSGIFIYLDESICKQIQSELGMTLKPCNL